MSYPLFRSRGSKTRTPSHIALHRPGNSYSQIIAMVIIWGSWLAFDAGTTLSLNFQSVMALCVTNLCASAGALTWAGMTFAETRRWSLDSVFMGAIAGLVMITPGKMLKAHNITCSLCQILADQKLSGMQLPVSSICQHLCFSALSEPLFVDKPFASSLLTLRDVGNGSIMATLSPLTVSGVSRLPSSPVALRRKPWLRMVAWK